MSQGKFVQTGSLNKAPTALRTAIAALKARHRIGKSKIPGYIGNIFQSHTDVKQNFNHPGLEHDSLFKANYEHEQGQSDCQSCNIDQLLLRKPRKNQDPVVHYGLIGSANQVMRHGATREKF